MVFGLLIGLCLGHPKSVLGNDAETRITSIDIIGRDLVLLLNQLIYYMLLLQYNLNF